MADAESLKYHRKDVEVPEDLVSIRQVLVDMSDPDGGIASQAARTYYYQHYATDEERAKMDNDDRIFIRNAIIGVAVFAVIILAAIIGNIIM